MKTTDLSSDGNATANHVAGDVVTGDGKQWELVMPLGDGATSEVWLARAAGGDASDPDFVAAKVFTASTPKAKSQAYERLVREATAYERLAKAGGSRFVVGLRATARDAEDRMVAIYDYASEGTLSHVARARKTPWREETVAWIGQMAARGLAQLGIVHRDIKPDNLMVDDPDGAGFLIGEPAAARVLVADLGLIARTGLVTADGPGLPSLTGKGQVAGTLPYLPIEALLGGSSSVDHRADQYALGVTLLVCLLRGHLSQQLDEIVDEASAVAAIENGHDLSFLPAGSKLRPVLAKMLSLDRIDRYRTWQEVEAALAAVSGKAIP